MIRLAAIFWGIVLCFTVPAFAADEEPTVLTLYSSHDVITPPVPLSNHDVLWLAKKRTLTVAIYGPESPPLSMNSATGRYRGMNADYLFLLQKALRISIVVQSYAGRQQAYDALKSGRVDLVLTSSVDVGPLDPDVVTSLPLVKGYPALVSRQRQVMSPLSDVRHDVTVAITQHYPSEAFIKASWPRARIVSYSDDYQALASVANGQSDYYFGNNLTTSFIITRDFYQTLNMVKYWRSPLISNSLVADKSQHNLIAMVDAFIQSLTEPMHNQLVQSWIQLGNLSFLNRPLDLTAKEMRWLRKHSTLRVLVNPYYAPFSMVDDHQDIRGLVGDILNLINLQTGLDFSPIIANSNDEMARIMRKGEWDILPTATYSAEREELVSFTHPFIATPFVIVTRMTPTGVAELSAGMKVAIPVYHTLSGKLKRRYPGVEWVTSRNTSSALSRLAQGEVDAVISTQLASRFIIDHYYPERLTYSRIPGEPPAQITFAVPRESPELLSILNKALDDIPPKEMLEMAGKWTKMTNVKIETWNLYSRPFYWVIGLATLLVLSSLMWGAYLLRAVRRRKASEAALQYQLSFRQTLFNAIPVPVYVMTPEGGLESYNHAFNAFFSDERHSALRYSMFDRRHPLANIFAEVHQTIEQGLTPDVVVPHQLMLNNGTEDRLILHWVTLCRMPAKMPPTIICGWEDITESRRLMNALQVEKDKAIEASRAKSNFLASMSHEIRTPVSAIMGFLELMTTRRQTPEENKESIHLAYLTAQSLIGLIGDVLDMEKIESGNFEFSPQWVDSRALIEQTISHFEGLADQKKIKLSTDDQIEEDKALWLDPQAVKQILSNLISNAVKFTHVGGVQVSVRLDARPENLTVLMIDVQDSGVGISAEEQEKLFTPFGQAQSGQQQVGSGLGLMICRELAERMGGQLCMTSQPGVGTRVSVTIPTEYTRLDDHAPVVTDKCEEPLKALRILIADDHPTNRLLLRRQLDTLGYRVDEAKDGVEALGMINEQAYDLLITDLNMPNMDGMELTRRVRAMNKEINIWGLTANAFFETQERCLASGMNVCLIKPIDLPKLKAALREIDKPAGHDPLEKFINLETLRTLALNDKSLMRKMLEQSLNENKRDILALRSAINREEWDVAQRHVHRINGTAQILGAVAIHSLAEQIESALDVDPLSVDILSDIHSLEEQVSGLNQATIAFLQVIHD